MRAIQKEMGLTIMQYLTEIRIGHARHLLTLHPEKKVLEIGKMCGFESPSYFGKIFKKEVGMTPEKVSEKQVKRDKSAII